jgi:tetratricopeptide (TPR) repeat protein
MADKEKEAYTKSVIYTNLVNTYIMLGDYHLAEVFAHKAIDISTKMKLEGGMAINYGNLGIIYRHQDKLLMAEEEFNKSLILFKKLNDEQGVCRGLMGIGNIKLQQKIYNEAKSNFEEGLSYAHRIGNKKYIADGYGNLCILSMEQRDFSNAENYVIKSLKIYEDINDRHRKAIALYNLASIYKETENRSGALAKWNESKNIFENIGLPHMVDNVNLQIRKLTGNMDNSSDPNDSADLYEFFVKVIKCNIPDGLQFSLEILNTNGGKTIGIDQETSKICFADGEETSVNNFINKIRLLYEKNPPDHLDTIPQGEIKLNSIDTKRYQVNIRFPASTYFRPTKGNQLLVKGAHGIIEIQTESKPFSKFHKFSIDRDTIAQRGWANTKDQDIGMVIQKNVSDEGKSKIGFESTTGKLTIHDPNEPNRDSILSQLSIDINRID